MKRELRNVDECCVVAMVTGTRQTRRFAKMAAYAGIGISLSLIAAGCGGGSQDAARSPHHSSHSRHGATSTTHPGAAGGQNAPTTTLGTGTISSSTPPPPEQTQSPTSNAADAAAGFQGIYDFAGNNSPADARNPSLAGVVLIYYWSQIEPEKGVFDWNVIADDMAPWIAAGKKVILRISTSGAASWDPPFSASGTPPWVFADGTRSIADNGETLPVYWDSSYLTDYQSFVRSFALQFDGNPHVAFIEPGIGMGGETLAETDPSASGVRAWQADGYTNALWLSTIETIASFFKNSFQKSAIFPLVDMTFFDGNDTDYATLLSFLRAISNWGLQYDGLTSSQKLSSQWTGRAVALEQRYATRTSHDCLCGDISNGLENLHGNYLLIYQSDIDNPGNAAYLRQTAAKATPGG